MENVYNETLAIVSEKDWNLQLVKGDIFRENIMLFCGSFYSISIFARCIHH